MPRKRTSARPRHSHPELVSQLAEEMDKEGVSDTPTVPTIYEEEQPGTDHLHVTVIWDRWAGIPADERGAVILDAYEKAGRAAELKHITLALGLTQVEAERLRIEL